MSNATTSPRYLFLSHNSTDKPAVERLITRLESRPLAQHNDRKIKVNEILSLASRRIVLNDEIEQSAAQFIQEGIKPMDTLHLASALGYEVDCFCTADDAFLKKAKAHATDRTKIVSPLELIAELAI